MNDYTNYKDDWYYIDVYPSLPPVDNVYCDTRDFHIICHNDSHINPKLKKALAGATDNNKFNRAEILGCLKALEMGSGGKGHWRYLSFNEGPAHDTGWIKYIRFRRLPEEVDLVGSKEPVYVAYTGSDRTEYVLLGRDKLQPENINQSALNFMEED